MQFSTSGKVDEMRRLLEDFDADHLVAQKSADVGHMSAVVRCLAAESKDPGAVRSLSELLIERKLVPDSLRSKQGLNSTYT